MAGGDLRGALIASGLGQIWFLQLWLRAPTCFDATCYDRGRGPGSPFGDRPW